MPLYEFECISCGYIFEQKQSFDADPVCKCPKCQNKARRLFHPPPIIFKGSGFYVTDYPKEGLKSTEADSRKDGEGEAIGEKSEDSV